MIKKIKKEVKVEEVKSIVCDKCGTVYLANEGWDEVQEFLHINFTGGYGSVFGDGINVQCDICQHCLYGIIGSIMRTKVIH